MAASDPSYALRRALVARLKTDASVAALIGARVYDLAPQNAAFPHLEIGEIQAISDSAECIDGHEVFATIHLWSRPEGATGSGEAHRLGSSVRAALHEADLDLAPDFRLVEARIQSVRTLREPDGITTHGVVTLRALIDPL